MIITITYQGFLQSLHGLVDNALAMQKVHKSQPVTLGAIFKRILLDLDGMRESL